MVKSFFSKVKQHFPSAKQKIKASVKDSPDYYDALWELYKLLSNSDGKLPIDNIFSGSDELLESIAILEVLFEEHLANCLIGNEKFFFFQKKFNIQLIVDVLVKLNPQNQISFEAEFHSCKVNANPIALKYLLVLFLEKLAAYCVPQCSFSILLKERDGQLLITVEPMQSPVEISFAGSVNDYAGSLPAWFAEVERVAKICKLPISFASKTKPSLMLVVPKIVHKEDQLGYQRHDSLWNLKGVSVLIIDSNIDDLQRITAMTQQWLMDTTAVISFTQASQQQEIKARKYDILICDPALLKGSYIKSELSEKLGFVPEHCILACQGKNHGIEHNDYYEVLVKPLKPMQLRMILQRRLNA